MKEGVEKAQGIKVKENDKTQLFVNGVQECVVGCMAKSAQNILLFAVAFSAMFCLAGESPIPSTVQGINGLGALTVITTLQALIFINCTATLSLNI